jgi:integral membrane protein|tara:strand:+ start:34661 stop:34945 length:285 start_codon:yes stop_codon:yes gene_type:complete
MKTLTLFRYIAFLEGLSYILLLFVGVPLKYLNEDVTLVKMLGMPHGLLFMGYIAFVIVLCFEHDWFKKHFILIALASIIPFGTFIVEYKLRKLN